MVQRVFVLLDEAVDVVNDVTGVVPDQEILVQLKLFLVAVATIKSLGVVIGHFKHFFVKSILAFLGFRHGTQTGGKGLISIEIAMKALVITPAVGFSV